MIIVNRVCPTLLTLPESTLRFLYILAASSPVIRNGWPIGRTLNFNFERVASGLENLPPTRCHIYHRITSHHNLVQSELSHSATLFRGWSGFSIEDAARNHKELSSPVFLGTLCVLSPGPEAHSGDQRLHLGEVLRAFGPCPIPVCSSTAHAVISGRPRKSLVIQESLSVYLQLHHAITGLLRLYMLYVAMYGATTL